MLDSKDKGGRGLLISVCGFDDKSIQATVELRQLKLEDFGPVCSGQCWASVDARGKAIVCSDEQDGRALAVRIELSLELDGVKIWP